MTGMENLTNDEIINIIADTYFNTITIYDLTYNEAWRKVFFGGLRIYTAVDIKAQEIAEKYYENRNQFGTTRFYITQQPW